MRNALLSGGPRLPRGRRGATSIEYVMIAALVSIAIIAGLTAMASATSDLWFFVAEKVVEHL